MASETNASESNSKPSFALNAIIGGVVGIIVSFVPLSPLFGGGLAGYLQRGTRHDGLKVGAAAGLIMLFPFVLIGFFLMTLLGIGGLSASFGGHMGATPIAFALVGLFVVFLSGVYTVGLSALGGYLGVYVRDEVTKNGE